MTVSAASKPAPSILRAAGLMGVATFLSRIMGLVREQAFAILFGAGNATDAFNVAFRIPNLLRDLFAEGAMSASLVPTFTQARIEQGERRAWRVAGLVFRVLFLVVGVLALLGILFAPELVKLYASAFLEVPGKFELTTRMTRIMFPFFPLVALAAAFMGILNACGIFFVPAFSSALFNIASVITGVSLALFLSSPFGAVWGAQWGIQPIEGMAVGVLIGGAVQALSQLPSLYRSGYRWQRRSPEDPVWFRDPALRRMLWLMVPGTVGLAATQVNILVNTVLATSQGPGAVSWLNYAFRLMQFPIGVFGVSIASATLPRVSEQWVRKDVQGISASLSQSLRYVFAINLPASAGLAFLGYPIIELIFQYGRFHADDTQRTAFALAMYAIGLTAYSGVKVLVPACYALGNTRLPVASSMATVAFTIILNLVMVKPFGYWGLALGTSVGAILNGLILYRGIRRLLQAAGGDLPPAPLIRSLGWQLFLALTMGGACFLSMRAFEAWIPEAWILESFGAVSLPFARGFRVFLLMTEGVLLVAGLAHLFKVSDTTDALGIFASKLKKKLLRSGT